MKPEYAYERSQSAGRMEAVMLAASGIGTIAALLELLTHGWFPCPALLLLSVIAFALSRVFDLLADVLTSMGQFAESKRPSQLEKTDNAA